MDSGVVVVPGKRKKKVLSCVKAIFIQVFALYNKHFRISYYYLVTNWWRMRLLSVFFCYRSLIDVVVFKWILLVVCRPG